MRVAALVVLLASLPAMASATDLSHAREALRAAEAASDRAASAIAIGASGDATDVPAVVARLESDVDADVRVACANALTRLGGAEARRALLAAQGDASPRVRAAAAAGVRALTPHVLSAADCGSVIATVLRSDRDIMICSDGSLEERMHPRERAHPHR